MEENTNPQDDVVRIFSEDEDGNLSDTVVPEAQNADLKDQATFYKALAGDDDARKIVNEQLGINLFK